VKILIIIATSPKKFMLLKNYKMAELYFWSSNNGGSFYFIPINLFASISSLNLIKSISSFEVDLILKVDGRN
jgi:hypothetical protein